jgi:hypothetical protein
MDRVDVVYHSFLDSLQLILQRVFAQLAISIVLRLASVVKLQLFQLAFGGFEVEKEVL